MPAGPGDQNLKDLPLLQQWILDVGPWLVVAVGLFLTLYPAVGTPSGAIAGTCFFVGPAVVLLGVAFPRLKSFKLSPTGLEADTFQARAVDPPGTIATRHTLGKGIAAPPTAAGPPPTIGAVVDAAQRQGWAVARKGRTMTVTNHAGQSFTFNRSNAADPISEGFLKALEAYGLTWP